MLGVGFRLLASGAGSFGPHSGKKELGPSSSGQGGAIGAPLESLSFQKDGSSLRRGSGGYGWRYLGCHNWVGD